MRVSSGTSLALTAALWLAAPAWTAPGGIHEDVPASIDPAGRYLIYLHGRILEV
jgi:hypothetical protein